MEIESNSSTTKRLVGLVLIFVLIMFFLAYVFCFDQLTWNNFFDKLFLISFFSTIINIIFYSPGSVQSHELLGSNSTPVKLEGSRVVLVSIITASIIAFLLSIAIPMVFQ